MVLSGEGGDEIFAGYPRYQSAMKPWWRGGRTMWARGSFDRVDVLRSRPSAWRDGIAAAEAEAADGGRSRLAAAQVTDMTDWLPHDLLLKLDRCMMAHAVEGRTPFLDPGVAKAAFRLPDAMKLRDGMGKWILRKWLEKHLPVARPFAPKQGFTVPVGEWIKGQGSRLGPLVAAQPGVAEIADPAKVRLLFGHIRRWRHGFAAWKLLFYALWHRRHILGLPPVGRRVRDAGRAMSDRAVLLRDIGDQRRPALRHLPAPDLAGRPDGAGAGGGRRVPGRRDRPGVHPRAADPGPGRDRAGGHPGLDARRALFHQPVPGAGQGLAVQRAVQRRCCWCRCWRVGRWCSIWPPWRRTPADRQHSETLWATEPRYRGMMRRITLVWALAFLVEGSLRLALIPLLPIALFLPISEAMSLGCIGLMIAWSWRYGSREMARIEVTSRLIVPASGPLAPCTTPIRTDWPSCKRSQARRAPARWRG